MGSNSHIDRVHRGGGGVKGVQTPPGWVLNSTLGVRLIGMSELGLWYTCTTLAQC